MRWLVRVTFRGQLGKVRRPFTWERLQPPHEGVPSLPRWRGQPRLRHRRCWGSLYWKAPAVSKRHAEEGIPDSWTESTQETAGRCLSARDYPRGRQG